MFEIPFAWATFAGNLLNFGELRPLVQIVCKSSRCLRSRHLPAGGGKICDHAIFLCDHKIKKEAATYGIVSETR
jgi:hypothetical protein